MPTDDAAAGRILVVDDEPANVRLLERLLATAGYREVESTSDSREVLDRYRRFQPDLVLLDLMMPHLDGVAVLEQLRGERAPGEYVPVLVLTADATLEAKRRALAAGAQDFVTKPFEQTEVLLRIGNLLETRRLYRALEAYNRSLEDMVRERTARLVQSEKVATMGSLLAGVAHELNNPLAILTGHAQLLRDTAQEPAVLRRADKITEAADRCVRIVRNFLSLARQRAPERGDVWLNQVVQGAAELLAYPLRSDDVEVLIEVEDRLPRLWADGHQLHQVLVNLLANAHHAMRRQPPPRRIRIAMRHDRARQRVRLEVADTGPGMSPEVRAKAFDAFFTTKAAGEGTGLGLSLCRSIIEEHGGTIEVESEPGRGTRFVIELPVVTPPRAAAAVAASEALPPVGGKSVLVVDDERDIADLLAESVARDGHVATVATDGAMALEMLAATPYDAIVCDTKMPVLDGETFYAELRRRFPSLSRRIVFLTGDVLSVEKREFLERTGAPYLTKPCDLAELRRIVHRLLIDANGTTAR